MSVLTVSDVARSPGDPRLGAPRGQGCGPGAPRVPEEPPVGMSCVGRCSPSPQAGAGPSRSCTGVSVVLVCECVYVGSIVFNVICVFLFI